MPEFVPGEAKIARVPITVQPAGLSCQAEVFLGPNEMTKVATSGLVPFTSTGASQNVRLPVIMPWAGGTYHVYIDVYIEGILIAAYQALEDVTIIEGNLLANPSFEDDLNGWTRWINEAGSGRATFTPSTQEAHTGIGSAAFVGSIARRAVEGSLSQVVPWSALYRGRLFKLSIFRAAIPYGAGHDINGTFRLMIDDGVGRSETEVYISERSWIQNVVIRTLSIDATKLEAIIYFIPNRNFHGSGVYFDTAELRQV